MTDIDNTDDSVVEQPQEQDNKRNPDGTFKPGVSGNPGGRTIGSISIITRLKEKFIENPDDFELYVDEIRKDPRMRDKVIEHFDGKPAQTNNVNVTLPQFMIDLIKDNESTDKE